MPGAGSKCTGSYLLTSYPDVRIKILTARFAIQTEGRKGWQPGKSSESGCFLLFSIIKSDIYYEIRATHRVDWTDGKDV